MVSVGTSGVGAIGAFVDAPSRREVAVRWLRAKVEREFDWPRVCEGFEDLYDELMMDAERAA